MVIRFKNEIMNYPFFKLIHILSATLMIGTGFGSAFYLYFTYKTSNSIETLKHVLKLVIFADKIFTTPSVIIQLITGVVLSYMIGYQYTRWFWIVLSISFVVFVLWIRTVFIQNKLSEIIEEKNEITPEFHKLMNFWFYLGIPSFAASLYLYYLMVYKAFL